MAFKSELKVRSNHARPTCPDFIETSNLGWKKSIKSQNEWSVRLTQEFKRSVTTLFITLTFDDDHLPMLNFTPEHSWNVPCFDSERVSEQLIRPLRQVDGYVFKYVFFPEFGSDDEYRDEHGNLRKGTMRPHYHGILYFDHEIDLEIFKQRVYELWKSCIMKCMPIFRVTDNNGFTRYVSKYVSKGIEFEHFPKECLDYVRVCRDRVQEYRKTGVSDNERWNFNYLVYFLHWYDQHRPKLICSKGIGNIKYRPDEYLRGTTSMFDGSKFKEELIPSYNLRNEYYDKLKVEEYRMFECRDGLVTYFDQPTPYLLQQWELNDIGREALKFRVRQQECELRNSVTALLQVHGPLSFDAKELYKQHHNNDLTYETYEQITSLCKEYINLLGENYLTRLCAWRLLFSKYSKSRFEALTGIVFEDDSQVRKYSADWLQLFDFLVDCDSHLQLYDSNHIKGESFLSAFETEDKLLYCLSLIRELTQYDKYLERKHDRELQKLHNKIKYNHH